MTVHDINVGTPITFVDPPVIANLARNDSVFDTGMCAVKPARRIGPTGINWRCCFRHLSSSATRKAVPAWALPIGTLVSDTFIAELNITIAIIKGVKARAVSKQIVRQRALWRQGDHAGVRAGVSARVRAGVCARVRAWLRAWVCAGVRSGGCTGGSGGSTRAAFPLRTIQIAVRFLAALSGRAHGVKTWRWTHCRLARLGLALGHLVLGRLTSAAPDTATSASSDLQVQ